MWVVEYDVVCHGDMRRPFEVCDAIEADFMAKGSDASCDMRRGADDPGWCWWGDVMGPDMTRLGVEDKVGCFFPLTRYSQAMLSTLYRNVGRNSGFAEVYFPTLCVQGGLRYEVMPSCVFGVFGFFHQQHRDQLEKLPMDDRWYHPVKT